MHTAQNKQTDKLQYQRHVLYFDFNSKNPKNIQEIFFFQEGLLVSLSVCFAWSVLNAFSTVTLIEAHTSSFFLHTTHQHKRVN